MNILFILYGDFNTNTASPIILFAKELHRLGHECVIAVPDGIDTSISHQLNGVTPITYDEILHRQGIIFSNGALADVVHACTLRIVIIEFLKTFLSQFPSPLVVYLEDNESWISQNYLDVDEDELAWMSKSELVDRLPCMLSNPEEYPYALALPDLIILIQQKLFIEAPSFVPIKVIPWGVDQKVFSPMVNPSIRWRNIFSIENGERVIVYHGGLNGFTRPAMIDLCKAIELINLSGVPCKLIRTGVNPINFWHELSPNASSFILEAGVVDRGELPSILALADLYVQPGRINPFEDLRLPSKLLEFFSMGKPVIMPKVNICQMLVDGRDAILLNDGNPEEIANACLRVFSNEELSKILSKNARDFAHNHFNLQTQTNELVEAYKEAIGRYSEQETKNIWICLSTSGPFSAAILRIRYLIKGHRIDMHESINQLLLWLEKLHRKLNLINSKILEPEYIKNTIDSLSVIQSPDSASERYLRALKNIFR